MTERFDLTVVRQMGTEKSRDTQTHYISGDGPFIVQQIDVLLADPRLLSFSLKRDRDHMSLDLPETQVWA